MCTISVSPRPKFLKHSRVLKQVWGREGWEASPCVCVCVCLSLGVCTHILVVGCFQPPSVTSNLPGSLGISVTLFLNKRLQSLRERPAPPAPPPLPPFPQICPVKSAPTSSRDPDLPRKSRLVTRTCLTQTGAGTSLDFFLAFSVVAALWKEMTNALEGDWNVIGGPFRGSRGVLLG